MATQLSIIAVTNALVALLSARMPIAYAQPVDVREAGKGDFNDKGELVLKDVAVRVRFGDLAYGSARDVSATTMNAGLVYSAICRHGSLRGSAETRSRSLALIDAVTLELAGARLLLEGGLRVGPIEVVNVVGVSDQYGPVEDCYGLTFRVPGMAQFDGRNANPQAGGSE